MIPTEQSKKTSSLRTDFFAALAASLPGKGTGVPSPRLAALAALVATAIVVALAPPSLAQAEACPNEALRTGFSAHLPDCRVYEMVSPAFKDGYGVGEIAAVSPNGESVVFFSPGAFAGAPLGLTNNLLADDYIARRAAAGWSTTSLLPPASLISDIYDGIQEVSPSLESGAHPRQAGVEL